MARGCRRVVPVSTCNRKHIELSDAAVAHLAAARAALQSAQEGVAYTEIRAPYAGVVTRRNVEVGETVGPGTPLMSGLSLQYLRVAVEVPQSLVDQVRRLRKTIPGVPVIALFWGLSDDNSRYLDSIEATECDIVTTGLKETLRHILAFARRADSVARAAQ